MMRLFRRLFGFAIGPGNCESGHYAQGRERLRVEAAGDLIAATLEQSVSCRDCGRTLVPWAAMGGPFDAGRFGVTLNGEELARVRAGDKVYFYPIGSLTYDVETPAPPAE